MYQLICLFRTLILHIFLSIWTFFCGVFLSPLRISFNKAWIIGYIWNAGNILLYRYIVGIKCIIINKHHLDNAQKPCIILSKHQSSIETFILQNIIPKNSSIIKEELTKVPFMGIHAKQMGLIVTNRQNNIAELKRILLQTKQMLNIGRSVVVYPQGTRVPINSTLDDYPYHLGIAHLYKQGYPFIPVGLNSGLYEKRGIFIKYPGVVKIEFCEPIPSNLEMSKVKELIVDTIESCSKRLAENV